MKPDTASRRVKDRVRQQVVQIHQHCCQHNQPGFFPVLSKKHPGDQPGEQQMQAEVNYWLQDLQEFRWCHLYLLVFNVIFLIYTVMGRSLIPIKQPLST